MKKFKWILCAYIAFIFIQSLFFKFTDAHETVHIFGILGEWSGFDWFAHYGAYGVGTIELIAALMLFTPVRLYGAILSAGVMSGAVFFHLFTPLGIEMPTFDSSGQVTGDDGGLLFYNACIILVASIIVGTHEFMTTDNKIKALLCRRCSKQESSQS